MQKSVHWQKDKKPSRSLAPEWSTLQMQNENGHAINNADQEREGKMQFCNAVKLLWMQQSPNLKVKCETIWILLRPFWIWYSETQISSLHSINQYDLNHNQIKTLPFLISRLPRSFKCRIVLITVSTLSPVIFAICCRVKFTLTLFSPWIHFFFL